MPLYKTVFETASIEMEVKKSKFIAEIRHIERGEEAIELLKEFKKRYYDASHNCYAYCLNEDGGLRHSGDDGEPSGTAGKPILDILTGYGLSDVMVVVTRYFGGTLLGTGGLVRAYSGATKDVLEKADVVEIDRADLITLSLEYALHPKLVYLCKEEDIRIYETDFLDKVGIKLLLPQEKKGKFFKEITEMTSGVLSEQNLKDKQEVDYYIDKENRVVLI